MVNCKKIGLALMASLIGAMAMAQEVALSDAKEKAGFMRSEGKIYVVAAVVLTILAGLIIYVARLDRKITKLEKGNRD
jgi:cell division protein FtsL